MWAWILRTAVAVGLDKWAKKKAGELIVKVEEVAAAKIAKLKTVQSLVAASGAGTAVFRARDGADYVVRYERKAE